MIMIIIKIYIALLDKNYQKRIIYFRNHKIEGKNKETRLVTRPVPKTTDDDTSVLPTEN